MIGCRANKTREPELSARTHARRCPVPIDARQVVMGESSEKMTRLVLETNFGVLEIKRANPEFAP